jgi:hypothetical protein
MYIIFNTQRKNTKHNYDMTENTQGSITKKNTIETKSKRLTKHYTQMQIIQVSATAGMLYSTHTISWSLSRQLQSAQARQLPVSGLIPVTNATIHLC